MATHILCTSTAHTLHIHSYVKSKQDVFFSPKTSATHVLNTKLTIRMLVTGKQHARRQDTIFWRQTACQRFTQNCRARITAVLCTSPGGTSLSNSQKGKERNRPKTKRTATKSVYVFSTKLQYVYATLLILTLLSMQLFSKDHSCLSTCDVT